MIQRRALLTGLISFVAAPAIVRASSLMPVKAIRSLWAIDPLPWDYSFTVELADVLRHQVLPLKVPPLPSGDYVAVVNPRFLAQIRRTPRDARATG